MPTARNEEFPLAKLRENPRNTRTHSKRQLRQLANNIQRFGFASPIITDPDGMILAGHARYRAAQLLGLPVVPVVVITGLTEAERRAFLLADNKLAEMAGWDRSSLAIELRELAPLLADAGLDIDITGFQAAEVDQLFEDLVDAEHEPDDDLPDILEPAVSRVGDLWKLGQHRLLCGDAQDPADVRTLMDDERAVMVFTDPPYNVRIKSVQGRGTIKHREFLRGSGELSPRQFTKFLGDSLSLAARHSTNGSVHFVCMDWRHMREMLDAGEAVYSELKNLIVWTKTNAGQGNFYRSRHELIFVWKNGDAEHINNFGLGKHGRNRSNVWSYAGVNTFRSGRLKDLAAHPTVKPVAMVADAMRDCSRRGDIVLDPFVGSGTTILAAERVNRRVRALDLDPLYVDVAVRRWQAFTKRDAVLQFTGETFDERVSASQSGKRREAK